MNIHRGPFSYSWQHALLYSTSCQTANGQMLAVVHLQHSMQIVCVCDSSYSDWSWTRNFPPVSSLISVTFVKMCFAPGKLTAVSIQLYLCIDFSCNLTTNWLLWCYHNVTLLKPLNLRNNSHYSYDHIRLLAMIVFLVMTVNENCWQWCLNPHWPMLRKQRNDC